MAPCSATDSDQPPYGASSARVWSCITVRWPHAWLPLQTAGHPNNGSGAAGVVGALVQWVLWSHSNGVSHAARASAFRACPVAISTTPFCIRQSFRPESGHSARVGRLESAIEDSLCRSPPPCVTWVDL